MSTAKIANRPKAIYPGIKNITFNGIRANLNLRKRILIGNSLIFITLIIILSIIIFIRNL